MRLVGRGLEALNLRRKDKDVAGIFSELISEKRTNREYYIKVPTSVVA